ncbi:MAG: DNA-binding protein WhiA [Pyramidobacter sp.]|nr:DNA-binding protein WhiA [Pyramidobacter sp.]
MKISTERWDEWFSAPITDSVSAESELSGIVACMKSRSEGGSVVLSLPRLWVFRRFRRLWPKVTWSADCELNDILRVRSRHVSLLMPVELYRKILARSRRADFIRWTWARGVYGCTGSIYNPRRGYYCLMRFHSKTVFLSVKELLDGSGITCSYRENGGVWELSIRDLQHIMRFCYFIGLESVASALEEQSMMRSSRDLANKQANCDSANIRRSVATSREHRAFIEFLIQHHPELIPEKLAPLAHVRLEYPEASLSDLGDLLRPQVSKSTVKYRLNKLRTIAETAGFSTGN